jgi:tRNA A37 threonylcarbamoyladenosine biosynthesis protein TsaE
LVHIDLYRLIATDRLTELDLDRWQADSAALVVVEWPERAPTAWHHVLGTIYFRTGATLAERQLEVQGDVVDLLQ